MASVSHTKRDWRWLWLRQRRVLTFFELLAREVDGLKDDEKYAREFERRGRYGG